MQQYHYCVAAFICLFCSCMIWFGDYIPSKNQYDRLIQKNCTLLNCECHTFWKFSSDNQIHSVCPGYGKEILCTFTFFDARSMMQDCSSEKCDPSESRKWWIQLQNHHICWYDPEIPHLLILDRNDMEAHLSYSGSSFVFGLLFTIAFLLILLSSKSSKIRTNIEN